MEYKDILPYLKSNHNVYLDFEEYGYNLTDKYPLLHLKGLRVQGYIEEDEFIDEKEVMRLYGEVNPNPYYRYPYLRLIVEIPKDLIDEYERDIAVIHLNKVFFPTGMQKVHLYKIENYVNQEGVKSWLGQPLTL